MKTNLKKPPVRNHEGVVASRTTPIEKLRRTVLACMLWEDGFYEDGQTIGQRIADLIPKCKPADVSALAIQARSEAKLRHAPLLIIREMCRHSKFLPLVESTLSQSIQRADELAEFMALYWKDGKCPIANSVKRGLASAFQKFNAYQLAKYNRDGAVKLRDVLFMCHAKPKDEEQAATWKQLVDGTLPPPDTWEVSLSGGADKKETFERLLAEKKLGYLALLRNLRNMLDSGVNQEVVFEALRSGAANSMALPFRFVAAARAVPRWEPVLDECMQLAMSSLEKIPGTTVVLIDTSPSMNVPISAKSDLSRMDAAFALAIMLRGVCEDPRVFAFSQQTKEVPPRNGMALADAIKRAVPSNGTMLGSAVSYVAATVKDADRVIIFTDEESQDPVGAPHCKGYMVNVATSQNGVGYGQWTHINGFSESVVRFISELEKQSD